MNTKPPVGVMPKWSWDEIRCETIFDAINRYADANILIPDDWIAELKASLEFSKEDFSLKIKRYLLKCKWHNESINPTHTNTVRQ